MTTESNSWVEPPQANAVRKDAIALARFAVTSPDLRDVTRKEVLSKYVLILLTHGTSNGKYGTRYRSRDALNLSDATRLEHEHVYPRKWLIERMMESPEAVTMIMETFALSCTVTSEEHARLRAAERANPQVEGWARYHAAGIEVTDMATGEIVPQSVGRRPVLPHEAQGPH